MIKYGKCSYPACDGKYIPTRTGDTKLCPKHYEIMLFFLWMLDTIKISKDKKSKGGLILP